MPIDTEALRLQEIQRGSKFTPIQFGDIANKAIGTVQAFDESQAQIGDRANKRQQAAQFQKLLNGGQNALLQAIGTLDPEDQKVIFGGDPNTIKNVTSTQEGLVNGWKRFAEVQSVKAGQEQPTFGAKVAENVRLGVTTPTKGLELTKPDKDTPDTFINVAFNQVLEDFQKLQAEGKTATLEDREKLILDKDQALGLGGALVKHEASKRFVDKGVRGIEATTKTSGLEDKLRNDFDGASKNFNIARDAFKKVEASAIEPSPAGDLSMIFSFMKVNDPTSVVRESEFATAANAKAWLSNTDKEGGVVPNIVRGAINKATTGLILLPEQRKDFLKRSRLLFRSQKKTQDRNIERFKGIAKRQGIDFRNVVQEISPEVQKILSGLSNLSRPEALQDTTQQRSIKEDTVQTRQQRIEALKIKEGK